MKSFSEFLKLTENAQQNIAGIDHALSARKAWKAGRRDVLKYWRTLQNDLPIQFSAIPENHKGSLYDQDGIRITGNARFITAIMSRLKELLAYETPYGKLDIEYRETQASTRLPYGSPDASYAFYVYLRKRKKPTK